MIVYYLLSVLVFLGEFFRFGSGLGGTRKQFKCPGCQILGLRSSVNFPPDWI